jgi:transcriptional regulator NrdR family protein
VISRKSVITFGMVAIPIAMYTATRDNDIHFNQLHAEDKSRIRYKKTCAHCGKEITAKEIVKGYEYDKDKYVVVTDEEIEKIKTEKEKSIQILHFAQLNQISPVYYDKTYEDIINEVIVPLGKPLMTNLASGHGVYKMAIPIGAVTNLNTYDNTLTVLEPTVSL